VRLLAEQTPDQPIDHGLRRRPFPVSVRARSSGARSGFCGMLHADVPPLHFFYVFAGASGLLFHQAEECKRLTGLDAFAAEIVAQHARVVERMLLGPSPEENLAGVFA